MKWMVCQLGKVDVPSLLRNAKGPEYLVPIYETEKIRNKTRIKVQNLLYPGYMFVSDIDSFNKLKIKYKDIYLLLKKTSVRGNIVVMSAKEIEEKELLKCIDRSMKIVTKGTCIPVNGFVKILSGPFAGYEAKVKASSENKLVVEVMLFKRPVNLDLYVENVEVID